MSRERERERRESGKRPTGLGKGGGDEVGIRSSVTNDSLEKFALSGLLAPALAALPKFSNRPKTRKLTFT